MLISRDILKKPGHFASTKNAHLEKVGNEKRRLIVMGGAFRPWGRLIVSRENTAPHWISEA
jgi:hypothetical protein